MSSLWVDWELCVVMLWLWTSLLNVTTGYDVVQSNGVSYAEEITTRRNKANELIVDWIYSTTSSMAISWSFEVDTLNNHTLDGSTVEYFVNDGMFTSHMFKTDVNSYVLKNLDPATLYTICVRVYETVPSLQNSRVTVSRQRAKCVEIATIPYIRRDSVLVLLLTVGYFAFMTLVGYSQWRRKIQCIRKRRRRSDKDYYESCDQAQPIRMEVLDGHQRMNNHMNSIEEQPA